MIKHKLPTFIFMAVLGLYAGNVHAANKYNEPCDEITASSDIAVTSTQYGKVAGYLENNIFTFKGIPYAKAERFMPPVAPDQWDGIRSSRAYGPTCPQTERMGWQSDEQAFAFNWDDGFPGEDCLRVNIWTQGLKDGKKRPVMVWLHGGGYAAGSGQELPSYDGAALSKKGDVVVVTLNHRLNVLGFLDLSAYGGKYAQSVNVGLLDLVAALRWVHNNIENFGGDPSNVTIFGQSGGGGKVSTLLATPSAKGLFQKAIVQSGSMQRTMESKYSRQIAAATLEELGIQPENIDKLQSTPYKTLLAAGEKAIAKVRKEAEKEGIHSFIFGWGPTVDGNILPKQPEEQTELSKDIPMMIGTTLHEFCISTYVPALRNATLDQAKEMLKAKYGDKTDEYIEVFKKVYPAATPKDLIDTDVTFRPTAIEQGNWKAAQHAAPVYMYQFAWESPIMDGILRSTHCMEIAFVFDNIARCASMTGGGKDAQALADKMSSAWIQFARTGNPSVEGLPVWEPYTAEKGATMIFNNQSEIRYNHDKELMQFISKFPMRGF
ncbi:carboxylesterase/lipase family protein [Phocaeicola sp.]|uniref:carboxylesterase/lipase family protein n=1 Tax=Phocaeicola sp. TaxID=2773926 RepID=UPI003AB578E8